MQSEMVLRHSVEYALIWANHLACMWGWIRFPGWAILLIVKLIWLSSLSTTVYVRGKRAEWLPRIWAIWHPSWYKDRHNETMRNYHHSYTLHSFVSNLIKNVTMMKSLKYIEKWVQGYILSSHCFTLRFWFANVRDWL